MVSLAKTEASRLAFWLVEWDEAICAGWGGSVSRLFEGVKIERMVMGANHSIERLFGSCSINSALNPGQSPPECL